MREFVTEKVKQIKPSGIRKFFDVVSEMPDAISLGVGEPDFDTPWHIRDAGIKSLKAGKTFYTSNAGLMELREEICRYTEEKCMFLMTRNRKYLSAWAEVRQLILHFVRHLISEVK